MKKLYTLLFAMLFVSPMLKAQTFNWLQTVDIDYEYNPGMIQYNTCANPQGGCYFYGMQDHISFYNESMGVLFLKKIAADGNEGWSRLISGQSCVKGMVCSESGDVYISGQMLENADFWGSDTLVKTGIGTDGFVARVSADGDLEWCLNLTGLPMGEGTVTQLAIHNGMLYIAYSTWMDTYVLVFNEDGEYIDSVVQGDVSIISGLDFDQQGNLYTTGGCAGWQATFGGVPYPAPFSYSTYITKYNSSFSPEWVKYIEDFTCTFPQVLVDEEGFVYFSGQLWAETLFDTIQAHGPEWVYDFFLARISPEGEYLWVRECPEVITGDATIGDLQFMDMDSDGNILLTGFTRGVVDWGNGIISDVTADYQDLIIWNYNPDGQVNWIKTAGGTGYELSHTISSDDDGSAYIAGIISGAVSFDTITYETAGLADPFLTRLDLEIVTGIPVPEAGDGLKIYPNPATDRVFIQSDERIDFYRILNMQGQEVKSGDLTGRQPEIGISELQPGFYFLEISGKSNQKKSIKLIKS
jgi:hypothetical protein